MIEVQLFDQSDLDLAYKESCMMDFMEEVITLIMTAKEEMINNLVT